MRLALIFNTTRPDTTGVYFARACQALGVAADQYALDGAQRIPAEYDLYLRIDHGDDYERLLPSPLRPAVFYAIDTHLRHSWRKIRRTAGAYDLVCCAQRRAALQLPGAAWIPLACDEAVEAGEGPPARWDIGFVGTDGGVPRKFYLQALRERYPQSFIGSAAYRELSSIYRQARIGFNYSIAQDINMRMFEVLAAKTLLITNALSHDDLGQLGLEDRRHLVLYRRPQELFPLIDHYLGHPDERAAIASAGWAVVRDQHTYRHRMQAILELARQRLGLREPMTVKEC